MKYFYSRMHFFIACLCQDGLLFFSSLSIILSGHTFFSTPAKPSIKTLAIFLLASFLFTVISAYRNLNTTRGQGRFCLPDEVKRQRLCMGTQEYKIIKTFAFRRGLNKNTGFGLFCCILAWHQVKQWTFMKIKQRGVFHYLIYTVVRYSCTTNVPTLWRFSCTYLLSCVLCPLSKTKLPGKSQLNFLT